MPKLNDTQTMLLSTASQRGSGSLLPLPDTMTTDVRFAKATAALIRGGFVEERETSAAADISRTDGDLQYGLFITAAGLHAIGVEPADTDHQTFQPDASASAPQRTTKSASVLALLGREQGATLAEMIAATGWLPHTTRAALTGLRKKGHPITRERRAGETCYRIEVTA